MEVIEVELTMHSGGYIIKTVERRYVDWKLVEEKTRYHISAALASYIHTLLPFVKK